MTRDQFVQAGAAIIATLAESAEGWAPSGHVYAALQCADAEVYTLDAYLHVVRGLTGAGMLTSTGDVLTITTHGRDMAAHLRTP